MVDLRMCEKGDMLVTKHGLTLTYVKRLPKAHYYDHEIKYPYLNGNGYGTRTHDGHVFREKRKPEDQDIIKIIKWNEIFELL